MPRLFNRYDQGWNDALGRAALCIIDIQRERSMNEWEKLGAEQLIAEAYRGIRPAPGYPACPDHQPKALLWRLLDAERKASMKLTESYAMLPASAVSGFYLSHPQSTYFNVGRIGEDQLADWAARNRMGEDEARRRLAPLL